MRAASRMPVSYTQLDVYKRQVYGLAAVTVPHHGGFTLVADADGGDAIGMDAAFELDFHHHGNLLGKNLHRVLLHPARMRTDGLERFGRLGNDATCLLYTSRCV